MKEKIYEILGGAYVNKIRKRITYNQQYRKNRTVFDLMKNNTRFKNIHNGETCFILGNGPSLKEFDLSLLHNAVTFTVNQLARLKEFNRINTTYHLWSDYRFFDLADTEGNRELAQVMRDVNTDNNKPTCFYPRLSYEYIKKYRLDEVLSINYFEQNLEMYEGFDEEFDFTKYIPYFCTVVQIAIALAIYMGFKRIYIMGCESTGFMTLVKSVLGESTSDNHIYESTKNEEERIRQAHRSSKVEDELKAAAAILRDFRILSEYCEKREIELIDLTPKGLITSLRKDTYANAVKEINKRT